MTETFGKTKPRWAAILVALAVGLQLGAHTPPTGTRAEPQAVLDASQPAVIAFGVMGDLPYSKIDEVHVPHILKDMHQVGARLALHVGDIKSSIEPCSEALLTHRIALLQAGPLPVVLTPGDNEWTDCHRGSAGRYDPLERLSLLRRLAWPDPHNPVRPGSDLKPRLGQTNAAQTNAGHQINAGQTIAAQAMEHQPGQPENARWSIEGLHFVTVHVVGSRNGLEQFPGSDAEMMARMQANAQWLGQTVDLALQASAQGLVIAFHADPDFGTPPGRGYQEFQTLLQDAAQRFKGPILLVHGDGHRFRVDQPLPGPQGNWPHVTRLEAFGWPRSRHWVLVSFEARRSPAFRIMTREASSDR